MTNERCALGFNKLIAASQRNVQKPRLRLQFEPVGNHLRIFKRGSREPE